MTNYDVVVVGGGAAGLAGALVLARARRRVVVVDAGGQRNAPAGHVHNYLGREGTPPAELVAIGRREVESYGAEVVRGTVTAARADGAGFVVTTDAGALRARRLLVATGVADELPDVPGLAERWGTTVLHCPYCHGWEVRDRAIGILGTGPLAEHQALLWRQLSADVTLFTHTGPAPADPATLRRRGIAVVAGEVVGVTGAADVRLAAGGPVPRDALVVATRMRARADWLAPLGLATVDKLMNGVVIADHLATGPLGRTDVPGVYAAGNIADPTAQVLVSAAAGLTAGAGINADLIAEDAA
ncbi:MAG: Thioredoxin reductase [uncultured Corynebacteriales bacterium]|uniref:Thioredoxin reductase n=1 Tax=uncultured Mycobacteriales bacterium TaxID=581187 RepID=A0A6J4HA16_9ACTN|nr:MAG: Thioredoxin reductase [uncultured Corynebacteriales bacterium]